nr:hypothetical protein [Angustibacter aerolatus]
MVRTKVVVGVLLVALAFYAVTIGWRGVLLLDDGRPVPVLLGVGVLLLIPLGAWAVVREPALRAGQRAAGARAGRARGAAARRPAAPAQRPRGACRGRRRLRPLPRRDRGRAGRLGRLVPPRARVRRRRRPPPRAARHPHRDRAARVATRRRAAPVVAPGRPATRTDRLRPLRPVSTPGNGTNALPDRDVQALSSLWTRGGASA